MVRPPSLLDFSPCQCRIHRALFWIKTGLRWGVSLTSMAMPPGRVKNWWLRRMGASIHPSAFIAPLVFIDPVYPKGVKIREDVIIGFRTMIVTHYISWDRAEGRFRLITGDVELEAGCFVGAEATVQPGCRVSSGTVIGERALVKIGTTCDGGVWVGVPAKRRD